MRFRRLRTLRASLLGRTVSQSRLRADGVQIGSNVDIGGGTDIDPSHRHLVSIGDDATLAPRVTILAHDASTKHYLGYTRVGLVRIGQRCFIGAGATILPGVSVGDGSIIGAGSVVTKDVPPGVVASGNPCKVLGTIAEFSARRDEEMAGAPVWERDGWTVSTGITPERCAEQRAALEHGVGYLE